MCLSDEIHNIYVSIDNPLSHLVYLIIVLKESLVLSICASVNSVLGSFGCYGSFGLFYFSPEWGYVVSELYCLCVCVGCFM